MSIFPHPLAVDGYCHGVFELFLKLSPKRMGSNVGGSSEVGEQAWTFYEKWWYIAHRSPEVTRARWAKGCERTSEIEKER